MPVVAPFGSWASPIAAADLAKSAATISDVRTFDGRAFWRESRPAEGGRLVLRSFDANGQTQTLTPDGFSVRSRVHEYGGSSYWVLGEDIVFANFSDQRLYLQRGEAAPVATLPLEPQWASDGTLYEALYRSRSPLFHLEGFTEPLITFQGAEDRIVTPDQSRRIMAALDAQGVMHAYFEFEGEQHGFRKAENIIRAQEAELVFYGAVFGFTPNDSVPPFEIKHPRSPMKKRY